MAACSTGALTFGGKPVTDNFAKRLSEELEKLNNPDPNKKENKSSPVAAPNGDLNGSGGILTPTGPGASNGPGGGTVQKGVEIPKPGFNIYTPGQAPTFSPQGTLPFNLKQP